MSGGISTIYVVRQKDSIVLFKGNYYIQSISWLSNEVVRFQTRPEVVRKTEQTEEIEFNVRTMNKQIINSSETIK
jgi:hypothetical protein